MQEEHWKIEPYIPGEEEIEEKEEREVTIIKDNMGTNVIFS